MWPGSGLSGFTTASRGTVAPSAGFGVREDAAQVSAADVSAWSERLRQSGLAGVFGMSDTLVGVP